MRVLGLSAGNADGSAEILLKIALQEAEADGAQTALLRLDDVRLPTRPLTPGQTGAEDDGQWLWDQVMESDGLIVSAPIYSRTVPGKLKLVADRLSGPAADVAFAESYRAMVEAGQTPPVAFPFDDRVFRPRVAGLIAVGGALTGQWKTLALPLMHQMMFSSYIAVADQALIGGAGMPRSVVLDGAALKAAARVGHSVGSQLGVPFVDVEYRGEPGLCPRCHLSIVAVADDGEVECATCGASGVLVVEDGLPVIRLRDLDERSVITMAEKRAHFREVQETGRLQGKLAEEIARRAAIYEQFDRRITPGS